MHCGASRAPTAPRALIDAASSEDEDVSTLAGMLLTRSGSRAVKQIDRAFHEGRGSLALIDVLSSIQTDEARQVLVRVARAAEHADQQAAATEALTYLDKLAAFKEQRDR